MISQWRDQLRHQLKHGSPVRTDAQAFGLVAGTALGAFVFAGLGVLLLLAAPGAYVKDATHPLQGVITVAGAGAALVLLSALTAAGYYRWLKRHGYLAAVLRRWEELHPEPCCRGDEKAEPGVSGETRGAS